MEYHKECSLSEVRNIPTYRSTKVYLNWEKDKHLEKSIKMNTKKTKKKYKDQKSELYYEK